MKINRKKLESLSPEEQKRYVARFEAIQKYKRVNPLYFYNHPQLAARGQHQRQLEFHALGKELIQRYGSSQVTRAFFGGNQSGKTTAGIADDLIQAVDREVLPAHLQVYKIWEPPFKCRIFTPDLSDTMFTVQDKIKDLVPIEQLVGNSWESAYNKIERVLRFKNGSFFQFMSYEQDIQKLGSATLHRIHYDEEPPRKKWEEGLPRLMRYGGDTIFTMTPLQGMSWTYNEIWRASGGEDDNLDRWLFENDDLGLASIIVDMDNNPYLTEKNKETTLRGYDENSKKARKEGRFVHFAGLIYNDFNPVDHVTANPDPVEGKPFKRNRVIRENHLTRKSEAKNVNIVVGIDPGYNSCSVLWACVDEDRNIVIFDELFTEEWTIKEICAEIHKKNAYHQINPISYIIDPHARDRDKKTGKSDQSEFTKYGVYTQLGHNNVETGVQAVKERLRDNTLIIYNNCHNLIREFKVYRFKEQNSRNEEDPKFVPIKKDDHCLDSLRYIVMSNPYSAETIEVDNRTDMEKIIDEDIESYDNRNAESEFGGGIFV